MGYQSSNLDKPCLYNIFHASLDLHATLTNLLCGQSAHQLIQFQQYRYHELHGQAEGGQKIEFVEVHLEKH